MKNKGAKQCKTEQHKTKQKAKQNNRAKAKLKQTDRKQACCGFKSRISQKTSQI